MKFYLDFEATQFSSRIISIGCSNTDGDTFHSLVKPSKAGDKVGSFVEGLTGITQEMVETAPTADEVFLKLREWVIEKSDGTIPQYFCYGDSDTKFIAKTVKHMTNFEAVVFASSIQAMLIDYSKEVKSTLQLNQPIALCKMYAVLKAEMNKQKHDALEDALMLQYVAEHFNSAYDANAFETIIVPNIPKVEGPKAAKAPEIFINWPNDKMDADTGADEENWTMKVCFGPYCKYFKDDFTMALWTIKYLSRGRSPKKEKDIKGVLRCIYSSIEGNRKYLGMNWEKKGND